MTTKPVQLTSPVAVFYRPEMSVAVNDSFSPSAGKPARVVADWLKRNLPIQVRTFDPVTREDLQRVHDRAYVDGVLDGKLPNGFSNYNPAVAAACLYTAGSLMAATRHVMDPHVCPDGVACSPTSGFHHAHYDRGEGFCTFNALALVALTLAAEGKKVMILDCDVHYGNGTDNILRQPQNRVLADQMVTHRTAGKIGEELRDERGFAYWLKKALDSGLGRVPDVVLYQAGADMAAGDPLGGFLHIEDMQARDRLVFERTGKAGIPLVWNLAGGYSEDFGGFSPVLQTHRDTLHELLYCRYADIQPGDFVPRSVLMAQRAERRSWEDVE